MYMTYWQSITERGAAVIVDDHSVDKVPSSRISRPLGSVCSNHNS